MTHLQSMNAAAGGRALAARQIDQVQPAASALSNVLFPGGCEAVIGRRTFGIDRALFPSEIDGQQSVATATAGILECRGCLPGLRALLHV